MAQVYQSAMAESEWDGARFQREKQSGVFLGLGWLQVCTLFIGLIVGMLVFSAAPYFFPLRVLSAVVVAGFTFGLAVPRPAGRPVIEWLLLWFKYNWRGMNGYLRFRRPWHEEEYVEDGSALLNGDDEDESPSEGDDEDEDDGESKYNAVVKPNGKVKPGRPYKLHLAGEFDDISMYTMPNGEAMLWDARSREALIIAAIRTDKAFELESQEHQEDRTRGFSEMITGIGRIPGVCLTAMSDQTTMVSGANIKQWYLNRARDNKLHSGTDVDPFLHESLLDAVTTDQGMPHHEMWLVVGLSHKQVQARLKKAGGGIGGMMRIAEQVMTTVERLALPTGAHVRKWHTPRSLAALSRSAFDPESSVQISERRDEFEGVAPHSAGPMSIDVHRDHLSTDSGVHRTYMISEFPQKGARWGFLETLVFLGDFRHTVTIIQKPRDQRKAQRQIAGRKTTQESGANIRRKWGAAAMREHTREAEDIDQEELELMEGHRAVKVVGLVTITGQDHEELEANCGELLAQAPNAGCEVRPLWWQQDSGFIASALPMGRISIK